MKFEIFTSKGKFYFRLKARNGQIILQSQGYATKASCMNGIKSVQTNATNDARFERKTSKDGRLMFNLLAGNKQIIGTSQMYKSKASCENGIAAIGRIAPIAPIVEVEG